MKVGILVVALLTASLPAIIHAQSDRTIGTWKVNLAKSKYDPGPPPRSETRIYEAFGKDGIKGTFNRVDAAGKPITISYAAQYDGKDYPYMGAPEIDTIVLKRLDGNTTEATLKKNGKVVQTTRSVISTDGKTRTQTVSGVDAKGQKLNNVVVFDRQ